MKKLKEQSIVRLRAFTLIELLVVIAIISLLAAMIVGMAKNATQAQRKSRAKAELAQIETANEAYKAARGHYPPDNPNNAARPPLFYELTGTVYGPASPRTYQSLYGGQTISESAAQTAYGAQGFINSAPVQDVSKSDQIREADVKNFLPNISPRQFLTSNSVAILGLPIDGPDEFFSTDRSKKINPWRYNSSNPTNNPSTFDLWVDITLRNKTNRICNWSQTPLILN